MTSRAVLTSMLMDRRMIVEEIGVTRAIAEKIMRHCQTKHRIGRRIYVPRAEVNRYLEQTKVAA